MKSRFLTIAAIALLLALRTSLAVSAPIVVGNFGDHGWNSGDTRPSTGGAANAAQIAAQIVFMGEGQVINDAAGGTPSASPIGSLNGLGYVRLDGTNANAGKSDLSYVSLTGIAPTSALLSSNFGLSYRYYADSNPTVRTLGLNIEFLNKNGDSYIFVHVNPVPADDAWSQESVSANSGTFSLYGGPGAPGGAGPAMTLANWQADPTWGDTLFGDTSTIWRVGFNLGSFQRNNLTYLDWVQSNLLNGGDIIDFQAVSAAEVPEPASLALWGLMGAAGLAGWRKRKLLAKKG